MSLFSWIALGLIVGFVASRIVNRTGEGVIVDILLGIVWRDCRWLAVPALRYAGGQRPQRL